MNHKEKNLLKYGIPMSLVEMLLEADLSVSTIRATSISNLVTRYGLTEVNAGYIKKCIARAGIDLAILDQLLLNNNFTCCCCLGTKGHSVIVHHIEEHHTSQDNSYDNLAVLCPVCHDLAHSSRALTLTISKSQVRQAKKSWEEACMHRRAGDRTPIMRSWQSGFSFTEGDDTLSYAFNLALSYDGEVVDGYFTIMYLPRGNMIIAGDFSHRRKEGTIEIDFYYWEMSHGIRASRKKEGEVKITYVGDDLVRWEMADDVLDWVPRVIDLTLMK